MRILLMASISCMSITCSAQNTQYWYGTLNQNVTVRDHDYYKRLDAIAQQIADEKFEMLKKSNDYYAKGDYESCVYYADIARDHRFYKGSAWCNIAASYAQMGDWHMSRKAYSRGFKRMDPEMRRAVESIYREKFGKKLTKRRSNGRRFLNVAVVTIVGVGAVGGLIYNSNDTH